MTFRELVTRNRSYRRFFENEAVSEAVLRELANLARLSPSGGNLQSLRYLLACDPARNALIFPHLAWAGYLKEWGGPKEGERPAAYILILNDKTLRPDAEVDVGIVAQTMMLGAAEQGLAGCMIGSIQREPLRRVLKLPDRYDIALVLALGKPREKIVLETAVNGAVKYWRDDQDVHHVPKRPLGEIVLPWPA
jgi:nitroreductase